MTSSEPDFAPATALRRVLPLLRCPVCGHELTEYDGGAPGPRVRTLGCSEGHRFDTAKQGYVTLLGSAGRTGGGDDAAQLDKRESVLSAGHFDPLVDRLVDAVRPALGDGGVLLDCGAGTGFYLSRILDICDRATGIGTEISAAAARRLAKAHPRAASVVADTWRGLPVADGSIDALTVVFAPRNVAEFARCLRPGGLLVVAWPSQEHLSPLREELGMLNIEKGKETRLGAELETHFDFDEEGSSTVTSNLRLSADEAVGIALMGPSGARIGEEDMRRRVEGLGREVYPAALSVNVSVLRRR